MRTEVQKRKAREQMRIYLSNPVRRELHNAFSSRWYHVTVKGSPTKLAKHRANVARAVKKYTQKNALQMYMYNAFLNLDKKEMQK